MTYTKKGKTTLEKSLKSKVYMLMLYNDEVNTFDHVIDTLVKVCGHSKEQAEQCTFLVHYAGKCDVKRGGLKELRPLLLALGEKGLTAEIKG
jgi:ATP-dependent Clp protease adaptor protein ClpS